MTDTIHVRYGAGLDKATGYLTGMGLLPCETRDLRIWTTAGWVDVAAELHGPVHLGQDGRRTDGGVVSAILVVVTRASAKHMAPLLPSGTILELRFAQGRRVQLCLLLGLGQRACVASYLVEVTGEQVEPASGAAQVA
jgi:hypothetical protein